MTDGKLLSGQQLQPEQTLVSVGGHAHLHYQGDGNLVVYLDGGPVWASHTDGQTAGSLKMRADGDLVITNAEGAGIGHTGTAGHPKAMVQLQDDGNFVVYEDPSGPLAGTPIWASASSPFIIEPVDSEPIPDSPVPPLQGPLMLVPGGVGQVVADQTGDVLPVFVHDGSDFSDWVHGRKGEVEARTKLERQAGYVGKRPFTVLGYYDQSRPDQASKWSAWAGREVTPIGFTAYSGRRIEATPDYYGQLREYVTMLADHGMTVILDRGDMVAFTPAQANEHMRLNGVLFGGMGEPGRRVLAMLAAGNEWWQNGPAGFETADMCKQMLNAFRAGAGWWPSLRGLSCPPNASEEPDSLIDWGKSPATYMTVHGSRAVNSHLIPHYFNYGRDVRPKTGQVIVSMEPIGDGHGVSVGRTDDPEVLTAIAASCLISGTIPVFMSGRGVWGEQGPDGPGGLDKHAGFWEVPRIPTWLPKDVMRFGTVTHSGVSQSAHRFVAAGLTEGTPRFDFALDKPSGRFAAVLHATDWEPLRILKDCLEFRIVNMVTGQVEREGPIRGGELLQHQYRRARLVTGVVG